MTHRAIRTKLSILPATEGGRSTPIVSGYRSLVRFGGTNVDLGFELRLDADHLAPGDSGTGHMSFWVTEDIPDLLVGMTFELREGSQIVGHGTVLEVDV